VEPQFEVSQGRLCSSEIMSYLLLLCQPGASAVNQGVKGRTLAGLELLHPLCGHFVAMADAAG